MFIKDYCVYKITKKYQLFPVLASFFSIFRTDILQKVVYLIYSNLMSEVLQKGVSHAFFGWQKKVEDLDKTSGLD